MRASTFVAAVVILCACAAGGDRGTRRRGGVDAGPTGDAGGEADGGDGRDGGVDREDAPAPLDAGPGDAADPCAACDPLAACDTRGGTVRCVCPPGYDDPSGDGSTCVAAPACRDATCDARATCAEAPGTADGYTCTCTSGYSGDGRTCTNVDECATSADDCHAMATCADTPGSFSCTCISGYTGDGRACTPVAMGGSVLIFDDTSETLADDAATALGMTAMVTTAEAAFTTAYDAGGWSVVVVDCALNNLPPGVDTRVRGFPASGGRVLFAYWDLDANAALASALGVSTAGEYTTPRSVYADPASPAALFTLRETVPSPLTGTDRVSDDGDVIVPGVGGFLAARLDSAAGAGAIGVTFGGRVIVMGFTPYNSNMTNADGDALPDMRELWTNMLVYVTSR
jgi:hypothetical protein